MHHSSEPLEGEMDDVLGATGEFPEGKLTESDEGEIRFRVGAKDGKVVLDLGAPVAWVGMTVKQARDLGSSLIGHAKRVEDGADG